MLGAGRTAILGAGGAAPLTRRRARTGNQEPCLGVRMHGKSLAHAAAMGYRRMRHFFARGEMIGVAVLPSRGMLGLDSNLKSNTTKPAVKNRFSSAPKTRRRISARSSKSFSIEKSRSKDVRSLKPRASDRAFPPLSTTRSNNTSSEKIAVMAILRTSKKSIGGAVVFGTKILPEQSTSHSIRLDAQ